MSCNMKLSIITVNLNNRDGLQKTIDSVVCQTFKDFEWIVIDGGSTDGSKELIEEYSDKISYWVSEPDKGIYNAMNKGIMVSHGEYALFLNSGDSLYNQNTLDNVFKENISSDIIYGNQIQYNNEGYNLYSPPNYISSFQLISGVVIPHSGSSFIKLALFRKLGYYDEQLKVASDHKFFLLSVILNDCSTYHIDKTISYFDLSGISSTETYKNELDDMTIDLLSKRIVDDYQTYENTINELRHKLNSAKLLYELPSKLLVKSLIYKFIHKVEWKYKNR